MGRCCFDSLERRFPAVAGLDAGYIAKQLADFKSGARKNISMEPFAQMLNDTQVKDVAAYYASLPMPERAAASGADPELLAHGERLALTGDWDRYVVSCVACHGPGSGGVGSVFPSLAGQHPEYLQTQLLAYRDGTRSNDPQDLMGAIARRMTDRDIDAVSAWLGAQPAPVRK
ncbi:MAG: c-type cytochrome [Alcaligenaceae bacterium]|nr:c-type cytochrome [Alcaligenaceae bacterium]